MHLGTRFISALVLATAFLAPAVTTGCATRAYRVYDPYDHHRWDRDDDVYYQQWIIETHRDPHPEFCHLDRDGQRQYWDWRHRHHDHDHDNDRH